MQYTPPLEQHETVAYNKQVHRPARILNQHWRDAIIQKQKHEAMMEFSHQDWLDFLSLTEHNPNLLPAEKRKIAIGPQGLLRGEKPSFNTAIKNFIAHYLRK